MELRSVAEALRESNAVDPEVLQSLEAALSGDIPDVDLVAVLRSRAEEQISSAAPPRRMKLSPSPVGKISSSRSLVAEANRRALPDAFTAPRKGLEEDVVRRVLASIILGVAAAGPSAVPPSPKRPGPPRPDGASAPRTAFPPRSTSRGGSPALARRRLWVGRGRASSGSRPRFDSDPEPNPGARPRTRPRTPSAPSGFTPRFGPGRRGPLRSIANRDWDLDPSPVLEPRDDGDEDRATGPFDVGHGDDVDPVVIVVGIGRRALPGLRAEAYPGRGSAGGQQMNPEPVRI